LSLQHYHTLPVIQFCRILAREGAIFEQILKIFEFFCIFVILHWAKGPLIGRKKKKKGEEKTRF